MSQWSAMKTIVAAIDFSNATEGVVQSSVDFALSFQASLHLFHVVEPQPTYAAYGFTSDEFPALHSYQEEAKRRAEKKLAETLIQVKGRLPQCHTTIREGAPLHSLYTFVEDLKPDLVVLGSHGHGVIASLLLGSVAEGMVRKAIVPTLIIPAPAAE